MTLREIVSRASGNCELFILILTRVKVESGRELSKGGEKGYDQKPQKVLVSQIRRVGQYDGLYVFAAHLERG